MCCQITSDNQDQEQLDNILIPVKDVSRLQRDDDCISLVIKLLEKGQKPSARKTKRLPKAVQLLMREWPKLHLQDGILYRKRQLSDMVSLARTMSCFSTEEST